MRDPKIVRRMKLLKRIGFGAQSARFQSVGLHPSFEARGCTYRYPDLSPVTYSPQRPERAKGIRYDRSLAAEELSRTLGHLVDSKLKEKLWIKTINGPGWHEVEEKSNLHAGAFSTADRFPKESATATPGPGIYLRNVIPETRTRGKSITKPCSFCVTPSFEYDNCMPRSFSVYRSYHLPPNIYKVKSSVEEILSKRVSKRGPYDLFTGRPCYGEIPVFVKVTGELGSPRDETSFYGYNAIGKRDADKGGDFDFVIHRSNPCNKFKGKFMKCGRETYPPIRLVSTSPSLSKPDPDKPGPNEYYPQQLSKPENAKKYPFDSSVMFARPLQRYDLLPPPGRYSPCRNWRIIGNGMRSAFLSKVQRGLPTPAKYSWFE